MIFKYLNHIESYYIKNFNDKIKINNKFEKMLI